MGNSLSHDEKVAIEVIMPVLDRVTAKEIAEHPAVSLISTQFRGANREDCALLLKSLKLPYQQSVHGTRQPQTQTSQRECGEGSQAASDSEEIKKSSITIGLKEFNCLIQDIITVEQDDSYNIELSIWNNSARSLWLNQSNFFSAKNGNDGVECVRSLYCGLNRVQQDDYLSALRRRFILLMLVRLRDRVSACEALCGNCKSGQTTKSKALEWIVSAIRSREDASPPDLEKLRMEMRQLLIVGNSYLKIRKALGLGFLFFLGGNNSRRCWETRINTGDITALLSHLQEEYPRIIERAKGLDNLALKVFQAGLEECGWTAFERSQLGQDSVSGSNKDYDNLTSIEYFLSGKGSVGDMNGDSHKKRHRKNKDSPQKRLCIIQHIGESDQIQATSPSEACLSAKSNSTIEDADLRETTISQIASNSSPLNNLVIGIPSSQSHTMVSGTTLQSGDTESRHIGQGSAADASDMLVHSGDLVTANPSLYVSTVTLPPESALGNSEDLQPSDPGLESAYEPAFGFFKGYAPGNFENPFKQAPGYLSGFVPGEFEKDLEQAAAMNGYPSTDIENTFEQASDFLRWFVPAESEKRFEQAAAMNEYPSTDIENTFKQAPSS